MKNIYFDNKKGFTLVELMVVVAIISILTAIVTTNFGQSKSKARDAKRVSDIAQLQLTLEHIFEKCKKYPNDNVGKFPSTGDACTGQPITNFISAIPTDNGVSYDYLVSTSGYDYTLRALLENNSSALVDDFDGTDDIDCSDTDPNFYYCVRPQ